MTFSAEELRLALAEHGKLALVTILSTKGSAPRNAGTQMLVSPNTQVGTIGGGALEWDALLTARKLTKRYTQTIPLGPDLGQCCGGSVELLFEPLDQCSLETRVLEPSSKKSPLWLYGAGHVGRAVVQALTNLPFEITWVDTKRARYPKDVPENISILPAADPAHVVGYAPDDAFHVVMTYSHAYDLEICASVLKRDHGWLGLIGSATKAARFHKRLAALGCDPDLLTCPIGEPGLGKEPAAIAIGLASDLLRRHNKALANSQPTGTPLEHLANSAS